MSAPFREASSARRGATAKQVALAALVALVYFATAHQSLALRGHGDSIASVWPASGLLVAAMWSLDRSVRGYLLAFASAASFAANLLAPRDVAMSVALSCVDVGECFLAVWLVERAIGGAPTFSRLRDVTALGLLGSGVAALVAGVCGSAILATSGETEFLPTAIGWWISAGVGILIVAPPVVTWRWRARRDWSRARVLEALAMLLLISAVAYAVFGRQPGSTAEMLIAPHAVLPVLIWTAARFGPREASLALLLVATATVSYTAVGKGPFASAQLSALQSVHAVQAFLAFAGTPTLLLAALIAERRAAEEELVESRDLSSRAEFAGRVGTWSYDPARDERMRWSDQTRQIFGLAPRDAPPTGATLRKFVHPDDAALVLTAIDTARSGGARLDLDHRIVRPDGEVRWVHAQGDAQRDGRGRSTGMVGAVRDVTDERHDQRLLAFQKSILEGVASGAQLEETLAEITRAIDAEIDGAACAVVLLRADVEPPTVERAIAPSLGTEYERTVAGFVLSPGSASCGAALNEGRTRVARDVSTHPAWAAHRSLLVDRGIRTSVSTPIVGSDEDVFGTVVLYLRVDRDPRPFELQWIEAAASLAAIALQRARAADALRTLASELERRVVERTRELEQANRELEAFSYSVSHDLRAPLRSIDGFTRILLDEVGPELPVDARENLERVSGSARRMGKLIDDLLAFSRLTRLPLRKSRVDPTKLAREIVAEMAHEFEGRQIELRVRDVPPVSADPALLRQVYSNLIGNALKFTRKRQIAHIEVGATRADGELVLWVQDDGVGFDMKHASKLFEVFVRLHTNDEFPGTGVGLALAQRIIHRHGGRIWADAKIDQGARFSFTLG